MLLRSLVLAAAIVAVVLPPASAHGPCGCLRPASGPPGTEVRGWAGYKVIFNPDRSDLLIGGRPLWSAHHGGPPVTVVRKTWRYSPRPSYGGVVFVVPAAAPGRYLVAIYDGSESGVHFTWEHFTVTASRRGVEPGAPRSDGTPGAARPPIAAAASRPAGVPARLFAAGLVAALVAGVAGGARLQRSVRP